MPSIVQFHFILILLIILPQFAATTTIVQYKEDIELTEAEKEHLLKVNNSANKMNEKCVNGQKFKDFQPGKLGEEHYKFLMDKPDEVIKLMEAHRDEEEKRDGGGMPIALFLIILSSTPFVLILIGVSTILYGAIKHTDHTLMLDKYYKDKED